MHDKIDWQNATIEDIAANPEKYGAPTFTEFTSNPEKYSGEVNKFAVTSEGGVNIKNVTVKHSHRIFGYKCKNEEEVEKVMLCEGYSLQDFDFKPDLVQAGGGKYEVVITWELKAQRGGLIERA